MLEYTQGISGTNAGFPIGTAAGTAGFGYPPETWAVYCAV
jgi:hypothetical protein